MAELLKELFWGTIIIGALVLEFYYGLVMEFS